MHVIGTAGHVDHGKSTLVEALTGIDPDRLKEEKEREMTIDLGFAWMDGEDGEEIGIVDVPGHRDFIENMLAGVGGIDLALLVIAADEGVMPQTTEHLAILDLLQVMGGIVAVTKVDLVEDPDWLELVILDIGETLQGTVLQEAPIIPVSAVTGQGLNELKAQIFEQLNRIESRTNDGRPRLPIDRVFTLSGFGTVVTGTLIGGRFEVGDPIEIQPVSVEGRIRGLQTHKTSRKIAEPGSRVAVNLTGIDKDDIKRGYVLAQPGVIDGTILCDLLYRHLSNSVAPLRHNEEVKFFTGSAEVMARTRVIGERQIDPGATGWLQLSLREPIAMVPGDRYILRRPSPPSTIGGGKVLDPHPGRRHKRFRQDVVNRFETLAAGSSLEILEQVLIQQEPITPQGLIVKSGLVPSEADEAWQGLLNQERAVIVGEYAMTSASWANLQQRLINLVKDFHKSYPLRLGIPREELRSRLDIPAPLFNVLLADLSARNQIRIDGRSVKIQDHEVIFTPDQQNSIDDLMDWFAESGINTPSVRDARNMVGEDVFTALLELGDLVQISDDVVYRKTDYTAIVEKIRTYILENGKINAAELRDFFNTSRKYAIALLEHLDDIRVTRRVGDDRRLL
jgi:selenocysteine-specific elongation factor